MAIKLNYDYDNKLRLDYRKEILNEQLERIKNLISGRDASFVSMITDENGRISEKKMNSLVDELLECVDSYMSYFNSRSDKQAYQKFFRAFFNCTLLGFNIITVSRPGKSRYSQNETFADIIAASKTFHGLGFSDKREKYLYWKERDCTFISKNDLAHHIITGYYLSELYSGTDGIPDSPLKNEMLESDCMGYRFYALYEKNVEKLSGYYDYDYSLDESYNFDSVSDKDNHYNGYERSIFALYTPCQWKCRVVNPDKFINNYLSLRRLFFKTDRHLFARDIRLMYRFATGVNSDNGSDLLLPHITDEKGNPDDNKIEQYIESLISYIEGRNGTIDPVQKEFYHSFLYSAIQGVNKIECFDKKAGGRYVVSFYPPRTFRDILETALLLADSDVQDEKELLLSSYKGKKNLKYFLGAVSAASTDFFETMDFLYFVLTGEYIFTSYSSAELGECMKTNSIDVINFLEEKFNKEYGNFAALSYDEYLKKCREEGTGNPWIDSDEYKDYVYNTQLDAEALLSVTKWIERLDRNPVTFSENLRDMYIMCDKVDLSTVDVIVENAIDIFLVGNRMSDFSNLDLMAENLKKLERVESSIMHKRIRRGDK